MKLMWLLLCVTGLAQLGSTKVVMCYFSSWAYERPGNGRFDVEDVDPSLCTHLTYAFAVLDNSTYEMMAFDPDHDLGDEGGYQRLTDLKLQNPELKTLISVGGWEEGYYKYADMASTPERRRAFINSALAIIQEYNFDGLDLDWEYPSGRPGDIEGYPEDKANYAALLQELRAEFDNLGLMLTAAVSAAQAVVDNGYDVAVLASTLDLIGVMTYDYHGWWWPYLTGINSPLSGMPEESDPNHPGYNLNLEWSINYWLAQGARPEQLLIGLPTYGRGFILSDSNDNGIYAEASDAMPAEKYTNESGYSGYNEICERFYVDGELDLWTIVRDPDAVAPYAVKGDNWIGYDDVESTRVKANFAMNNGLGGAIVWSIDTDDFRGDCGQGAYPLLTAANEVHESVIKKCLDAPMMDLLDR